MVDRSKVVHVFSDNQHQKRIAHIGLETRGHKDLINCGLEELRSNKQKQLKLQTGVTVRNRRLKMTQLKNHNFDNTELSFFLLVVYSSDLGKCWCPFWPSEEHLCSTQERCVQLQLSCCQSLQPADHSGRSSTSEDGWHSRNILFRNPSLWLMAVVLCVLCCCSSLSSRWVWFLTGGRWSLLLLVTRMWPEKQPPMLGWWWWSEETRLHWSWREGTWWGGGNTPPSLGSWCFPCSPCSGWPWARLFQKDCGYFCHVVIQDGEALDILPPCKLSLSNVHCVSS